MCAFTPAPVLLAAGALPVEAVREENPNEEEVAVLGGAANVCAVSVAAAGALIVFATWNMLLAGVVCIVCAGREPEAVAADEPYMDMVGAEYVCVCERERECFGGGEIFGAITGALTGTDDVFMFCGGAFMLADSFAICSCVWRSCSLRASIAGLLAADAAETPVPVLLL